MSRAITLFAILGYAMLAPADDAKKTAEKLEGRYTIISGEHEGRAIPKEDLEGSVVVITENSMVATDKDKKQFFACTYTLSNIGTPRKIAMTSNLPKTGENASGIIEMTGGIVKICYALPGGEMPTEFKAHEKQNCFVLKKVE